VPPSARNPKVAQFTVRVDETINERVNAIADRMGQNKATVAAMLIAAGLNLFEPLMGIGVSSYVEQASKDKTRQLADDVSAAIPGLLKE
jgi:hypothetical protein